MGSALLCFISFFFSSGYLFYLITTSKHLCQENWQYLSVSSSGREGHRQDKKLEEYKWEISC